MKAEDWLRDKMIKGEVNCYYPHPASDGLPKPEIRISVDRFAQVMERYAKEYYQSKCCHKVIEPNGLVYRFNNVCEKCGKILNQ